MMGKRGPWQSLIMYQATAVTEELLPFEGAGAVVSSSTHVIAEAPALV